MNSIDIFPWNENFNTGLPIVDQQHRKLVQLINTLASHVAFQSRVPELGLVFDELADYTVYHFQTEEKIWSEFLHDDPDETAHCANHASFIDEVMRFKSALGSTSEHQLAEEALGFLARWLASHILESDRHMAYAVLALQDGLSRDEAKARAKALMGGTTRTLIDIIISIYSTLSTNTLRLMRAMAEHRQDEISLKKESDTHHAFLRCASDGIHILDQEGNLVEASDSFCSMLGYSRDELIGQNVLSWDNALDEAELGRLLHKLFTQPTRSQFERRHRRKDGSVFDVEISGYPFQIGGQPLLFNSSRDITERKRIAAELAQHQYNLESLVEERTIALLIAKDAAEAASRAKSAFLSNMSHELRTPMNAIIGMTSLALKGAEDPKLRNQLGKIDNASKHLLAVINDILDISKIEAERMTLEDCDFLLADVLGNLDNMIGQKIVEKRLELRVDLSPALATLPLRGDPLRLGQIMLNLTGNAIKFTETGVIALRLQLEDENPTDVILRLEVQDTGIGISAGEQQRLFTAFEQADGSMTRKYGGTGLGLAISKRLVKLMGGEIGVKSHPGVGSTFWFTVPLRKRVAAFNAVAPSGQVFAGLKADQRLLDEYPGARILLVEDEPISQEVSRGVLEDVGFLVDLAEDGVIAVSMAKQASYDLILMDMQMPNLNGIDATRAIRQLPGYADLPILAMTANAFDEDKQICIDAGMSDHISKPVDPARLYETLLKWLSIDR